MANNSFFEEQKEQSFVKSIIVSKYFDVWANIMINVQKRCPRHPQKIAYIDLFAGPGCYKDGTISTPVRILTHAIEEPELRDRLVTIFNDKIKETAKELEKTISEIPGIETLKYKPKVCNQEVGKDIVKMFESKQFIPTLFFVDPWGYKGLSLRLVDSVLKDWGCDAIFFFNYNRINMGIDNESVKEHMQALFGEKQAIDLRYKLSGKDSHYRELLIVEEFCQALKTCGQRYILPFRFKDERGRRTNHHLIFVTKNFRGYDKMKEIMANESTSGGQGVPSFEYNPADFLPQQTLMFQLFQPLGELKNNLLDTFKSQRLTMEKIYEKHSVDTPYIRKNYKEVLRELYDDGFIEALTSKGKPPRQGTFGNEVIVTFPS